MCPGPSRSSSLQGKKYNSCDVHLTILHDTVALQRGVGSCSLCSASQSTGPLLQRLECHPVLALWQHAGGRWHRTHSSWPSWSKCCLSNAVWRQDGKKGRGERGSNLSSHQERIGYNSAFLTRSCCLLCIHFSLLNFAMFSFLKVRLSTSTSCLGI